MVLDGALFDSNLKLDEVTSNEEVAIMNEPVKDVTKLKPIVGEAVKALYGKSMDNIKIMKADQFPLFREPKQGWLVHAEFNDEKYEYNVQMADGRITRSVELQRTLIQK